MSIDSKILNKILAKQRVVSKNHMTWDLSQGYKDGLISTNQTDFPH